MEFLKASADQSTSMASEEVHGSDDSGTISDVRESNEIVEWPTSRNQQKVASVERILSCSTNSIKTDYHFYTAIAPLRASDKENVLSHSAAARLLPLSNPGSPVHRRNCRTVAKKKTQKLQLAAMQRTHSLPRDSLRENGRSPTRTGKLDVETISENSRTGKLRVEMISEKSWKPVPKPRKIDSEICSPDADTHTRAFLINSDLLQVERDSLEVVDGMTTNHSDVKSPSTLDISDSMCNLMVCRDSLNQDYVNINDLQLYGFRNDQPTIRSPPQEPPRPPLHRTVPSWVGYQILLWYLCMHCIGL